MSEPYRRKEVIGNAVLYLGDCLEILPTLPKVDAVITDPPYGIGEAAGKNASREQLAKPKDYGNDSWDNEPISPALLGMVIAAAKYVVIFGGNYYPMPAASKWLVWDKMNSGDFADCELAWTNLPGAVRIFRHMWNGMIRDSERGERVHPTQKPVALMRWCLQQAGSPKTVIDPFMGSAPVGIACHEISAFYYGIEREPKYFDIACERIENAQRQQRMFP
jgi:site-specific DNA-methyltransferase (adenine-specific)